MFDFDKYVVSELKALCAELGIVVANSARKPEYVEALKKFFEADNVADTLMGLGHENLKKVCRRLSLQAGSKTKRELTDAILAKVNPQPGPVVTAPVVITDPEPENRKGLPWWAWALIVLAAAFLLWGIFRPRPAASIDLTPIQTGISNLTTSVAGIDKKVDGLSDRVSGLEQAPAAKEPEVEVPSEPKVEAPVVIEVNADQTFNFVCQAPAYSDFRSTVRQPGDSATFVWNFVSGLDGAVITRIWPDDELISAKLILPGKEPVDITKLFDMVWVKAGGTGDAELDKVLEARGVNVVEGEILMQNKNAVALGNVPAGSKVVFEIKDNESLAVNRGIGVVIDSNYADGFTVNLP